VGSCGSIVGRLYRRAAGVHIGDRAIERADQDRARHVAAKATQRSIDALVPDTQRELKGAVHTAL
jgi:hypothetical protein